MESTAMLLVAELLDKGFLELENPEIGNRVEELHERRLLSPSGLDFLKTILHNQSIEFIARSLLGPCKLGHWLKYNARPGHIEGWRTGGKDAGLRVLLVLALEKGSRVIYYSGSQLHDLPVLKNVRNRGLPETTRVALDEAGCIPVEKFYPDGALKRRVVTDARLYREIESGNVIKHAVVANDALTGWPVLKVEEELKEKIASIQSSIGINFEIQNPNDVAHS
ncbi:hypothetical protein G3M48_000891 [Beauveria asiatica]|uniref:Uncharacterized protein n=1 Tax=Beauveria asiatica TaxID=1069075 RepID=A0AAW0S0Y0_9HYPO